MKNIKVIIFDWEHTLFDSETKKEYSDARQIMESLYKNRELCFYFINRLSLGT